MNDKTRLESATAPTRVEGPAQTRLEGARSESISAGFAIPRALQDKYRFLRAFNTLGAEADLALVERTSDKAQHVLKVYRRGLSPKVDVIEALRACDRRYVVETLAYGESDGLWYEILEFGAHGTLRDVMTSGSVKSSEMLQILRELYSAVSHIHEKQIIHRDLKPENVLLRSRKPLDLILTDFGIASKSDATQHFTTRNRTVKYGAPEAAAGAVGAASDYWSLGLMILEGLTGKHPYDGLSDLNIALQLATSRVDVSAVKDPRWRNLCQGLLIRDPKKRWGAAEVGRWLEGENPPLASDDIERPSQKPYKFAKRECWTAPELALELASNWKEGERHLGRGLILPWLREELRDQDAANLLIDLSEDKALKTDERLLRLICGLARGLPPVWRGISLGAESLTALCKGAIENTGGDTDFVPDLFKRQVLSIWGQAGNEECADWQRLWVEAVRDFPAKWAACISRGAPEKQLPSQELIQHATLLLIVSKQYRASLAAEMDSVAVQVRRCDWVLPLLFDQTVAGTLVRHFYKAEAVDRGRLEIESAAELARKLNELETTFAETIADHPEFDIKLTEFKKAAASNRAIATLSDDFPQLKQTIFEVARRKVVGGSLRELRRRYVIELLCDATVGAALFVLLRYWLGHAVFADGYGFLAARVEVLSPDEPSVRAHLFVGALALLAFWALLRISTAWVGHRMFAAPGSRDSFQAGLFLYESLQAPLVIGLVLTLTMLSSPPWLVQTLDVNGPMPIPHIGWAVMGAIAGAGLSLLARILEFGPQAGRAAIDRVTDVPNLRSAEVLAKKVFTSKAVLASIASLCALAVATGAWLANSAYPAQSPLNEKLQTVASPQGNVASRRAVLHTALQDASDATKKQMADAAALQLFAEVASYGRGSDDPEIKRIGRAGAAHIEQQVKLVEQRVKDGHADALAHAVALSVVEMPRSLYLQGQLHAQGRGGAPRDPAQALEFFGKAAALNFPGAAAVQKTLATQMLEDKDANTRNSGYKYFEAQAAKGDLSARSVVALRLHAGDGIKADPERAGKTFLQLLQQDEDRSVKLKAFSVLGDMRQSSKEIQTELDRTSTKLALSSDAGLQRAAFEYLEKRANEGDAAAQLWTASRYREGRGGVAQNTGTARAWYRRALASENEAVRERALAALLDMGESRR